MALWGSKKEAGSEEVSQPMQVTPDMVATIVANALAQAGIGQQQQPVVQQSNEEQTPEQMQESRIKQLETTIANMTPYARAIESGIPSTVREQVVSSLTEGEKEIYQKYKHEVDGYMKDVTIEAKSNPLTHRKAISLVLGEHVREVAELTLQRAGADDVPHLAVPSLAQPPATSEPELTPIEREFATGFAAYSRNQDWSPQEYNYYKNISRGYLHDMVRTHKERQAANRKES